MNAEQRAKVEANRKLALERLRKRGILNKNDLNSIESRNSPQQRRPLTPTIPNGSIGNNSRVAKPSGTTNSTTTTISTQVDRDRIANALDNVNSNVTTAGKEKVDKSDKPRIRPSIRTKDYIEYDFATMENLNGGYINPKDNINTYYGDGDDYDYSDANARKIKTLEDWRNEQRERKELYANAPPPEHMSLATKCQECQINIEMDPILNDVFKLNVCKQCAKLHPEKYSLLTKTECKEDYFLTEPELSDTDIFHKLEKPNPHSGTFARMQLFVRCEIEAFAFKKWGGEEGLDEEWQRRESNKLKRRETMYKKEIQTMRLKTRAQEFTKRLREQKYGKLNHKHEFSDPISTRKDENGDTLVKKRCIDCGMEIEDFEI